MGSNLLLLRMTEQGPRADGELLGFLRTHLPRHTKPGTKFEAISLKSPSNLSDDEKMKGTSPGGKSVQRVWPSAGALPSFPSLSNFIAQAGGR